MADIGARHPSIVQKIAQPNLLFVRRFPDTKSWSPAIQKFCGADAYVDRVLLQRPLVLKCQGSASPLVSPSLPVSAGAPLEKRKVLLSNFIAGGISLVSQTAIAPINRVQLLMQSQNEMIKSGRLSMPYKGIVDCFGRTIRNEGIISLWRGNTLALIRVLSNQAFTSLLFRYNMDNYGSSKGLVEASFFFALSSLLYPLEYARIRLANDIKAPGNTGQREFKGLIDVYRKTLNSDGIAGLYRGFNISVVGRIVSGTISGGLLRSLTPMIQMRGLQHSSLTSFTVKLGTTVCGMLTAYSTNTVSNRMKMTSGKDVKYKSSLDAFNQIIKNEGIKSLYKGAGAHVIAITTFAAFNFGFHKLLLCLLKPAKKNESAGESTDGASPDAGRFVYGIKVKWK